MAVVHQNSPAREIKDLREDVIEPKKGVFKLEIAGPEGQTPPLCSVYSSSSSVSARARFARFVVVAPSS